MESAKDRLGKKASKESTVISSGGDTVNGEPGFISRGDVCTRHEDMVRDVATALEAIKGLSASFDVFRDDVHDSLGTVHAAFSRIAVTNGVKIERLTRVETKVSWLASILGAVAGGAVSMGFWLWSLFRS